MSIGIVKINNKNLYNLIFPDLSHIVIPFSEFFKSVNDHFIYNGTEQIPFKEKDPKFIDIMKKEFL